MRGPNSLRAFAIRVSDAGNVIEGVDLMANHPMHRFMELWNGRDEFDGSCGLDFLWPVLLHPLEEIDKPLTRNVVADEEHMDHDDMEDKRKNIVHVRISGKESTVRSRTQNVVRTFPPSEGFQHLGALSSQSGRKPPC